MARIAVVRFGRVWNSFDFRGTINSSALNSENGEEDTIRGMSKSTKLFTLRPGSGQALESVTEGHLRPSVGHIKRKTTPLLRKAGVRKAAVFGSVVSGGWRRGSDIDVLIEFKGRKSLLDLIALEDELKTTLGAPVDLVTYRSIHPLIRDRVLKEQQRIL